MTIYLINKKINYVLIEHDGRKLKIKVQSKNTLQINRINQSLIETLVINTKRYKYPSGIPSSILSNTQQHGQNVFKRTCMESNNSFFLLFWKPFYYLYLLFEWSFLSQMKVIHFCSSWLKTMKLHLGGNLLIYHKYHSSSTKRVDVMLRSLRNCFSIAKD